MLEVKDQETCQTKKAVTNQVINYVLEDVVKEVFSENGRKNLEGEKVKGGRTLLYRVTFKNPATTERTFTVTDELPEGVTFVSAENDGTYDETTNTITWTAFDGVADGNGNVVVRVEPEVLEAASFVAMGLTDTDGKEFYENAGHNDGFVGYYNVAPEALQSNFEAAV